MDFDKGINKEYTDVIAVCKLLRTHATNALLLDNGVIAMQPIIDGIRNYMVLHDSYAYPRFRKLYMNLGEIAAVNTKFKKTRSSIQWYSHEGATYIEIKNEDQDPYRVYVLTNPSVVEGLLDQIYKRVPYWSDCRQAILSDEPDEMYTSCEGLAYDLFDKKMCRIVVNGNQLMFSKPFLGDTKNTELISYRVVSEDPDPDGRITVKFKQKEKLGNIYTYASFLKIPYTEGQ